MLQWHQRAEAYTASWIGARLGRTLEWARYLLSPSKQEREFWIVSCARNTCDASIRCLDSVYSQKYDRTRITHLFIDDASTDGTYCRVQAWLATHPDHSVQYVRNPRRIGGTENTVEAFRSAPAGSVVVEVNGDDWLPDPGVIPFLDRVYASDDVWMTYNSFRFADATRRRRCRPLPARIVRSNGFRDYRWVTQHLHSFRAELFRHVDESDFIDPDTGEYWESADDQAIYLALLELAGTRSRHIHRTTYVYNPSPSPDSTHEQQGSAEREARIRQGRRYHPLARLDD